MKGWAQKAVLWVGNFVAQYHFYLVVLVTSSFLVPYVGEASVGYVFVGSSIVVALMLYAAPALFRSFGTRNVLGVLAFLEIGTLLALTLASNTIAIVLLITAQSVLAYAIFIGIDLLIEAVTASEAGTGNARGLFLTANNAAVLLASLSLSVLVGMDEYYRVFVAATIVMLPFLALSSLAMPTISHPGHRESTRTLESQFATNPSLRRITLAHLLLQIFFAWLSIYTPILLHFSEGFPWSEVGIILALAMIPYLVLELPLGVIADRWLGEKEILITGFCIIVISLVSFSLLHGAGFVLWSAFMIFSRIGAAMVESMTEVHFFRHVDQNDSDIITTFRVLRPAGTIIGALAASLALLVVPLSTAFALFAVVMILGVPLSLSITDSK